MLWQQSTSKLLGQKAGTSWQQDNTKKKSWTQHCLLFPYCPPAAQTYGFFILLNVNNGWTMLNLFSHLCLVVIYHWTSLTQTYWSRASCSGWVYLEAASPVQLTECSQLQIPSRQKYVWTVKVMWSVLSRGGVWVWGNRPQLHTHIAACNDSHQHVFVVCVLFRHVPSLVRPKYTKCQCCCQLRPGWDAQVDLSRGFFFFSSAGHWIALLTWLIRIPFNWSL